MQRRDHHEPLALELAIREIAVERRLDMTIEDKAHRRHAEEQAGIDPEKERRRLWQASPGREQHPHGDMQVGAELHAISEVQDSLPLPFSLRLLIQALSLP
jgi:hypothetical protein